MPITFTCDCGKPLQAEDQYAGRKTRCPACGRELAIPGRADAVRAAETMPPAGLPRWENPDERRWDERADESAGAPRTSGKAVASMVVGIVSLCLPVLIPAAVAGILGILGLQDISRGRGRVKGSGFAIAGIVMAVLSIVLIPVMLVAMLVPA